MDLMQLRFIATGGQADIYEIDAGKIVKLMHRSDAEQTVDFEIEAMKAALESGIRVPRFFEKVWIDERPGIVMEKIIGNSLLNLMQRAPLTANAYARDFAELHFRMSEVDAPDGIVEWKVRFRDTTMLSDHFPRRYKSFLESVLKTLPSGNRLLHGDFHPGNILIESGNTVLIDWCNVTKGHPLADVANSLILLKRTPRIPKASAVVNLVNRILGKSMAAIYLKSYRNLTSELDENVLAGWTVLRAAERLTYCLPSEKAGYLSYIDRCYQNWNENGSMAGWLKYL